VRRFTTSPQITRHTATCSPRAPTAVHPECDYDDDHLCNEVPTGEQKPAAVLAANPELRKQAYKTCRERLDTFLVIARCVSRQPRRLSRAVPTVVHRARYLRFRECVDMVDKRRGIKMPDRGYVNPPDHREQQTPPPKADSKPAENADATPGECTPALKEKLVACKRLQASPTMKGVYGGDTEACKKVYAVCKDQAAENADATAVVKADTNPSTV